MTGTDRHHAPGCPSSSAGGSTSFRARDRMPNPARWAAACLPPWSEHLQILTPPQMPITLQSPAFDHIGPGRSHRQSRRQYRRPLCCRHSGCGGRGRRPCDPQRARTPFQPVAALIQALVPANEVPVSATRESSVAGPPAAHPGCQGNEGGPPPPPPSLSPPPPLSLKSLKNLSGLDAVFLRHSPRSSFLPRRSLDQGAMP